MGLTSASRVCGASRPHDAGGGTSASSPIDPHTSVVYLAAALLALGLAGSALAGNAAAGTDASWSLDNMREDDDDGGSSGNDDDSDSDSSDDGDGSSSDSSDGGDGSESGSSDGDDGSDAGSSDDDGSGSTSSGGDDGSTSGSSDGDDGSDSGTSDDDDGSSSPSSDEDPGSTSIKPAFSWDPTAPRVREAVQFHDQTEAEDEIEAWRWDLGNGSSAQTRDPTHAYQEPGTYTVRLTVTDSEENTATTTQVVQVDPGPLDDVVFTNAPTNASTGEEVVFEAEARDGFGNARDEDITYKLASGPGQINPRTGVYTSQTVGAAILHAIVRADDGSLQQWATTTVTVSRPEASANRAATSPHPGAIDEARTCARHNALDAHGDRPGDQPRRAAVNQTNETSTSSKAPQPDDIAPSETEPNSSRAASVSAESHARTDTVPTEARAEPALPSCGAAFEATCEGLNCTLGTSSTMDPNGSLAFTWSIDGETIAEGETVNRSFDQPGTYQVTLAVTDADGLVDQATGVLRVQAHANGNQTPARAQHSQAPTPGPGGLTAIGALVAVAVYGSADRRSGDRRRR